MPLPYSPVHDSFLRGCPTDLSLGRQRHCAWQRTRFVRSLIGCTIMLAAPHVLRQRARRPQRPRSNCPAAVVVSLPTSGSAPQPGRMSNRVDISALWRMYYRWHRLRLRDARVRERRRHVLRPRHIPRARATRSAICKVRWQWRRGSGAAILVFLTLCPRAAMHAGTPPRCCRRRGNRACGPAAHPRTRGAFCACASVRGTRTQ